MTKFKKEILDEINRDKELFSLVCEQMDVLPVSLPKILFRNGATLNRYGVVKAVADYLGRNPEDLVEPQVEIV